MEVYEGFCLKRVFGSEFPLIADFLRDGQIRPATNFSEVDFKHESLTVTRNQIIWSKLNSDLPSTWNHSPLHQNHGYAGCYYAYLVPKPPKVCKITALNP